MTTTVETRVTRIEELMDDTWRALADAAEYARRVERTLDLMAQESREFKDEMRTDTREFKAEMRTFKDEMRADRREMNKKWGELANKMGTLAEDLVAPSVPRILREVVGCHENEITFSAVRVRRRSATDPGLSQEFDVVVVCREIVLINETKSSLNARDMDEFVAALSTARDYFPEHGQKRFIGVLASLYVEPSVVRYGETQRILMLGMGEELMEVLNTPGFRPQEF